MLNKLNVICTLSFFLLPLSVSADPMSLDVFTDFESVVPNSNLGEPITFGTSPMEARFGGDAFGGIIGVGALYHSGARAWMVSGQGNGQIEFGTAAGTVEFYARTNPNATLNTQITAFDAADQPVGASVTVTPADGWQLLSFTGAISHIDIVNLDDQMNAIDDFGFSPVPEPTSLWLGLFACCLLRRRTTVKGMHPIADADGLRKR